MDYSHVIGLVFGELTIEKQLGEIDKMVCICSCGSKKVARLSHLRSGSVKSCGCLLIRRPREVHGKTLASGTAEYKVWISMINRCTNAANPAFHRYGGRGISVCNEWMTSDGYSRFIADMGPKAKGQSIDRIDNNGPYSAKNCRWTDAKTQGNNRECNRWLDHNGETKTISEWSSVSGVNSTTIVERLARGWSASDAITKTASRMTHDLFECDGQSLTLSQWSKKTGIKECTLRYRITHGWSMDKVIHTTRLKSS